MTFSVKGLSSRNVDRRKTLGPRAIGFEFLEIVRRFTIRGAVRVRGAVDGGVIHRISRIHITMMRRL